MWSAPVTFGGGIMIENVSSREAFAPARKAFASSHARVIRGSASAASNVLSIAIALILSGWSGASLSEWKGQGKAASPFPHGRACGTKSGTGTRRERI